MQSEAKIFGTRWDRLLYAFMWSEAKISGTLCDQLPNAFIQSEAKISVTLRVIDYSMVLCRLRLRSPVHCVTDSSMPLCGLRLRSPEGDGTSVICWG